MFSDGHVHFERLDGNEVKDIVKRAKQEGIEIIVAVGMDLESSTQAVNIAETYDIVYAALGIHPWNAVTINEGLYQKLKALASREKVVATGEIGLDFLGDLTHPEHGLPDFSAKEVQKKAFTEQLRLTRELGKPAIVHNRGADQEIIGILKEEKDVKAVLHDFMGDEIMLLETVNLGCYFSIGRAMLVPESVPDIGKFHRMVKKIPAERLLLETDMIPGYPEFAYGVTRPWHVKRVAEHLAELRGTTAEEIGALTTNNLKRLLTITPIS